MNNIKYLFSIVLYLLIAACTQSSNQRESVAVTNPELQKMFDEDQADRMPPDGVINWDVVLVRDSLRLKRAFELVDSQKILTAKDYYHAAMIFQHGYDTLASGMAVQLMQKAVELDSTINKWLLAAAIDRDLQRRGKPQIFGIQFTKNEDGVWELYDIDTTKVDDAMRKKYGVASLAALRKEAARLNDE